jgi:hypothetical protein
VAAAGDGRECKGALEVKEVVVDACVEPWLGPAWAFTRGLTAWTRVRKKGMVAMFVCINVTHVTAGHKSRKFQLTVNLSILN